MISTLWYELFDGPFPGDDAAVEAMAAEVRALRLLTDTVVTTVVEREAAMRSREEIEDAHGIISQWCAEIECEADMQNVPEERRAGIREVWAHAGVLCWVLRCDHNDSFVKTLKRVGGQLMDMGFSKPTHRDDLPKEGAC